MTAAPNRPLVERVRSALSVYVARGDRINAAQAALDACHAEEMQRQLALSALELETAAELLHGHGLDGMASIFTDAANRNRALLAKLEGRHEAPAVNHVTAEMMAALSLADLHQLLNRQHGLQRTLRDHEAAIKAELGTVSTNIHNIQARIRLVAPATQCVGITDHAVLRYLQRVGGIDLDFIRGALDTDELREAVSAAPRDATDRRGHLRHPEGRAGHGHLRR